MKKIALFLCLSFCLAKQPAYAVGEDFGLGQAAKVIDPAVKGCAVFLVVGALMGVVNTVRTVSDLVVKKDRVSEPVLQRVHYLTSSRDDGHGSNEAIENIDDLNLKLDANSELIKKGVVFSKAIAHQGMLFLLSKNGALYLSESIVEPQPEVMYEEKVQDMWKSPSGDLLIVFVDGRLINLTERIRERSSIPVAPSTR